MVQTQQTAPQKPATQPVVNQQTGAQTIPAEQTQPIEVSEIKPFWKKWWFWVIIGLIIIGVGIGVGVGAYFLFFK